MTHQGYTADRRPYIDRCTECADRMIAAERDYDATYGAPFFYGGLAKATLRNAGVPSVALHESEVTWTPKRFLRPSEMVYTVHEAARGWVVGEWLWEFNDGGNYGGSTVEGVAVTAVVDWASAYRSDEPRFSHWGLTRVSRDPQRNIWMVNSRNLGENFKGDWAALADRVRELASG